MFQMREMRPERPLFPDWEWFKTRLLIYVIAAAGTAVAFVFAAFFIASLGLFG